MLIQTEFDNPLEDDIVFEETEQTQDYAEILKNSENMLKAYMYIKRIADSSSPFINKVLKVTTVDTALGKEEYQMMAETGKILIKNVSTTESYSIYFNDGEFILFPYENIELPVEIGTKIETQGRFSIIESEYKLGKG